MIIPDFHLERFSKKRRKVLIEKLKLEILRKNPDIIIFNGDFWRGGKRNRSRVISLLYRIERAVRKKIILFPGSHEDISYRKTNSIDNIMLIEGSQFHIPGNFKKIGIDFERFWELLASEQFDYIITHDPPPNTVDHCIYIVYEEGIVSPLIYQLQAAYSYYFLNEKFRKKIDKMEEAEIEETLISLMIYIIERERRIISKIFGEEYEPLDWDFTVIRKILSFFGGSVVLGPAVYFEEYEMIKHAIIEEGIRFVISGHIHENMFLNYKIIEEGETKFVNPGPGYLGYYCLLDTDKDKVKIRNFALKYKEVLLE